MARKAAEAVESVRATERRAREEKEELAKLRRRADELVRKAYFRYAGAYAGSIAQRCFPRKEIWILFC